MNPDNINIDTVKLTMERLVSNFKIDDHVFSEKNREIHEVVKTFCEYSIASWTQWFLMRKLIKDYTFRHPKNLWHLLLYFCFGKWTWFSHKFIHWTVHIVSCKEAYGNIAMPKDNPVVYVQRFKNGSDTHKDAFDA